MFKRILLISGLLFLTACGAHLRAVETGNSFPAISLNPTDFNIGALTSPEPVNRRITINNFGKSLLYISKIQYT